MDTFGYVVIIILAIGAYVVIRKRKKCCSSCSTPPVKEAPVNNTEALKQKETPANVEPQKVAEPVQPAEVKPAEQPVITKVETPVASTTCCPTELPQDSILRRHYLTNLSMMIETVSPRPTDSVLCRHYDALLLLKIEQCLNDAQAVEQLQADYESTKR